MITAALNRGEPVLALSLDCEKAFDSVWHGGLIEIFHDYGVPTNLIRMISSFLRDRFLSLVINNTRSSWHRVRAGVPQGSVLSPLLYAIYISMMPKFNSKFAQTICFADDTLYLSWGDPEEAEIRLQTIANKVHLFCKEMKIGINESKSELLKVYGIKNRLSNRVRRITKKAGIFINGIKTNSVTRLRYLGVILNERFTFGQHLEQVIKKANAASKMLGAVLRSKAVNQRVK